MSKEPHSPVAMSMTDDSRQSSLWAACALERSGTVLWEWDIGRNTAAFSKGWRELLAMEDAQALGTHLDFIGARMREEDWTLFQEHCARIAAGETNKLDLAVRIRRFDSTWAWVLLRGAVAEEPSGPLCGIALVVSLLRLDKRFSPPSSEDSPSAYQTVLEYSPLHIMRFDRELFPFFMNPASCEYFSLDRAEIGISPESLDFLQEHVNRVFETGEVVKFGWTLPRGGRGPVVGDMVLWPELDQRGQVKSVISQFLDRTAEIMREKEAQLTEMRFASLHALTQMEDMSEEEIMEFTLEKIAELTGSQYSHLLVLASGLRKEPFIIWSPNHFSLLSKEELNAMTPSFINGDFCNQSTKPNELFEPVIRNSAVRDGLGHCFAGKLPVSRCMAVPVVEDGQIMCIAAVYNKESDYTFADQRQLQLFINGVWHFLGRRHYVEALKTAKDKAEQASKAKNRFLASVSHELRTPLNGLLSMLQLLERSELTQEQAEFANRAQSSGHTLLRIISDILDYSRMESGKFELALNPFDIIDSLTSTIASFKAQAEQKGLSLQLTVQGEFPPLILGDEARIRQILYNLVGNSLKFTERGEIQVTCTSEKQDDSSARIQLSVRDTGIGIPLNMQDKIFEAFTQADDSNTRKHQGSGLGLGIVRQLTQHMNGAVSIWSRPGQGTIITCSIPFAIADAAMVARKDGAAKAISEGKNAARTRPFSVLVAEDDPISRFAMRKFLDRLGFPSACVENGREALEALRLYSFDCLISDVFMPEIDGIELTRHIRQEEANNVTPSPAVRKKIAEDLQEPLANMPQTGQELRNIPKELPIVAVSAHAMTGDREYFLEEGMDYYLSKPVRFNELEATLFQVQEELS